jgi:hypothetical protein
MIVMLTPIHAFRYELEYRCHSGDIYSRYGQATENEEKIVKG